MMRVDVAIIGAGTAGMAAYRAATKQNKRAVIIESGPYGTTCARVGCMPSKLLIAAGDAAYEAKHAGPFGVHATVRIDGTEVMNRVKSERDRFVGFVIESVESFPEADRLRGHAKFVDHGSLEVESSAGEKQVVHFTSAVIATGSSPVIPPMFEAVRDRVIINDDVFVWDTLPKSVAVFGSGVIGLELGQALSRLGVKVHVFGRHDVVGGLTDPAVKARALAAFREEFPVDVNDVVQGVRRVEEGVEVTYNGADGKVRLETFAFALVSAGRRPNVAGLDLAKTGIASGKDGKPTYDFFTMQCGSSNIFIAGDANGDLQLLHEAADEGAIAGENAARYPHVAIKDRRSLLAVVFTEPNIAVAGDSLSTLEERGATLVTGEVSFDNQGRSRVMRQNRGLGHVYADAETGRFLGAELCGPRVEHIAHLLAWAHQQRLTIPQMLAMPFYHPVVEEGLRTALRDAAAKLQ